MTKGLFTTGEVAKMLGTTTTVLSPLATRTWWRDHLDPAVPPDGRPHHALWTERDAVVMHFLFNWARGRSRHDEDSVTLQLIDAIRKANHGARLGVHVERNGSLVAVVYQPDWNIARRQVS